MPDTTTPDTTSPDTTISGVRAFDQNGNEVIVPREQWAGEVLPNMLQRAWDSPDQLYFVLVNSLNEGFAPEIAGAAEHLYATDSEPARGATIWGVTLIQLDRLVEAEMVLAGYLDTHAPDQPGTGSVLVTLAKVFQAKGETRRAESTLVQALQADPNEDNALGWFAALTGQRDGEQAVRPALQQIAAHPLSWRPQLWLAREELTAPDPAPALSLYSEALARAPRPVPPELLVQMTGDLGNAGRLDDLVSLAAPHFVPEVHGLAVGNNLIKAHLDLNLTGPAAALVDSLAALNQPDWQQPLAFWRAEIARRTGQPLPEQSASQALQQQAGQQQADRQQSQIQIGIVRIDGPVWLPTGSPARAAFPARPAAAPIVLFLGGSAEMPEAGPDGGSLPTSIQFATALNVLTRALPLFLAEQTEMRTAAAARTILPWAVGEPQRQETSRPSGFIVANQPWPDATAVQAALQSSTQAGPAPSTPADLVVTVHVDAEVTPWEVSLTFLRSADSTRIGELSAEFLPENPTQSLLTLADEMTELLAVLGPAQPVSTYILPENLPAYLSALDNLLILRCATMPAAPIPTPEARAAILENATQLAAAATQPTTLLLAEIQTALKTLPPTA